MRRCEFFLGVPEAHWVWNGLARGSCFVSFSRWRERKRYHRAKLPEGARVAVDSESYTMLSTHGRWLTSTSDYVDTVRRVNDEVGELAFASIRDWMCEPWICGGGGKEPGSRRTCPGTGYSLRDHQAFTIESLFELRQLAPEIPWLPVVQGYTVEDYLRHVEDYKRAGVDLRAEPRVGAGSVCRRNRSKEIGRLLGALVDEGLSLHGFGIKAKGLERHAGLVDSVDSMAWARRGMFESWETGEVDSKGTSFGNSQEYAEAWRERMEAKIAAGLHVPHQRDLVPAY